MENDDNLSLLSSTITAEELLKRYTMIGKGPSIIVVGPDRVGKTTLVKHLSSLLHLPSFKSPSERRIFAEGGRQSLVFDYTFTHYLFQAKHGMISDRGYPCERVYSKVFGRETDHDLLELTDLMHSHLGTKILYVMSSVLPKEEDDLVPQDKYFEIVSEYDAFCKWTKCEVVKVDTAKMLENFANGVDSSFNIAFELKRFLEK